MKRLLSALLVIALLFINTLALAGCDIGFSEDGDTLEEDLGKPEDGEETDSDNGDGGSQEENKNLYDKNGIIKPVDKEYDRNSKTFELYALDYVRPDVDKICADFDAVCKLILANEVDYADQLEAIYSLEEGFTLFKSMETLAEIFNYKDLTNKHWIEEYEYTSTNSPRFAKAVEELFVTCARSPHVDAFERDYFGEDIEEEYKDGGSLSQEVVEIMEAENKLIADYKAISPATVTITAFDEEMTFEDAIEELKTRFTEGSNMYNYHYSSLQSQYAAKSNEMIVDTFIELVKVRYLLAEELGYDSYIDYAYEQMGYEYTSRDFESLLADIRTYAYPVYSRLYNLLFYYYFNENPEPKATYAAAINTAYNTTKALDDQFSDIFNFMLLYGLYDVGVSSNTRFDNAFTTYLDGNDSPFMFITANGVATDYETVTHEFGHFIDYYVNGSNSTSLELAEVCSQGFEMLSLIKLKGNSSAAVYKYLLYDSLCSFFETLIYQGLYAAFEHKVYSLEYESINEASLLDAIDSAERSIFGTDERDIRIIDIMIPHMFIAPMYVQSYATSIIPSMEIYLLECANVGEGLAAYKTIIYRDGDPGFLEALTEAGLSSPFERGILDYISDEIYYLLTGMHYKIDGGGSNAA